jgi:hypothetical protein
MTFTFTIELFEHLYDDESKPLETYCGELQVARYSDAKIAAWPAVMQRVQHLRNERGILVGCGELRIAFKPEEERPV